MTYFLTFHGELLCRLDDAGTSMLVQCPLHAVGTVVEPISTDVPVEHLRPSFDQFLRNAPPTLDMTLTFGRFGAVQVGRAADGHCVTLTVQGQRLSAFDDRRIRGNADQPDWEGFLPISAAELDVLRLLLGGDWVVRSSGALVRSGGIALEKWYTLRAGSLHFDLRFQLPFDLSEWPFRLTLLRDGWRIEQLCLYRPLICFAAFGDPAVMRQLYVSVRSLVELAGYAGDILVLTDQTAESVMANLPSVAADRLHIHYAAPADFAGFVASKYNVLEFPLAAQFQPVMLIDPDVVFDTDVAPMLCAVARSDRIAAPLEPFSPLRTTPSAGSGLLELDGCSPRFAVGFNAGTLGVPNLRAHAATLRLIRTIIVNHAVVAGRTALPWVDQEVANYVSFRLAGFDRAIDPFVRYGGWPDTEPSTEGRAGVVHFWPALSAADKLAAMEAYRRRLDAVLTPGHRADGPTAGA